MALPSEIQDLLTQYDAAEGDAKTVISALDERSGTWRPSAEKWSVAHCLDHLDVATRVYLDAMFGPVEKARVAGRSRKRPVVPGFLGKWFANTLEPPVSTKLRMKAPKKIIPVPDVSFADATEQFLKSQQQLREFVLKNADLDLASIHFPNPFIRGLSFTVASGLYIIAAHQRRHLWQAHHVRDLALQTSAASATG